MSDGMTRSGTVILLGAGASRDVSYPLGSDIHEPFLNAVEKASLRDIEIRKMAEARARVKQRRVTLNRFSYTIMISISAFIYL
ncbi:MAG: hypothetical protein ACERKJ_10505 [Candidatus Dadabacteria bacterium]